MVYKFFDSKVASPDKKSVGSGAKHVHTKLISQNEELADEPHKPINRRFKKEKYIQHLKIIFGVLFSRYAIIKQML